MQRVIINFLLSILPIILWADRPNLLLLQTYRDQNISGWVVSEKLDGIRAYWSGTKLLTRSGKEINAPRWFTRDYPPFEIDGELWSKRADFENISSIVRDKVPSESWREIKHYIFEVPNAKGGLLQRLEKVKAYQSDIIKVLPQIKIKNQKELYRFLKEIETKRGEGVVVRDPNAPYIDRRTHKALKLKSFKDDECIVVGYTKGRGKFKNMVGAIECQMKNGTLFKIGTGLSNQIRKTPPPIGEEITFKYQNLTKYGKPRFPVFLRVSQR